jgi:hypothetical protein
VRRTLRLLPLAALLIHPAPGIAADDREARTVHVFHQAMVHFLPDSADRYAATGLEWRDNGRIVARTVDLPSFPGPHCILARLTIHPVPKSESTVHDPWDRAGTIRLVVPGAADLEVVKFVTAYGGRTEHTVDVTELAPLLGGRRTFLGFIDTWLTPAWRVDLALEYRPIPARRPAVEFVPMADPVAPDWIHPLLYDESFDAVDDSAGGIRIPVDIPEEIDSLVVRYLVSGHCTDGRDADEFVTKWNVVSIDGVEVARFQPWRDDCRRFRDVNPYGRRWTDGSWSPDYSRSGWCPGDAVLPRFLAVTPVPAAGRHDVRLRVEGVRPKDASGLGYWRVSAALLGWRRTAG